MAVGSQTLAVTDRDGRRLRKWPLVHRPWPVLTGEDGVVTVAISWVDIVFDSFLERRGGPIRIKPPLNHTR